MKYVSLFLVLVLCVMLLCACGKQEEPTEPTTVSTTAAPTDPTTPEQPTGDASQPEDPTDSSEDTPTVDEEANTLPMPRPDTTQPDEDATLQPPIEEDDGNWGPLF